MCSADESYTCGAVYCSTIASELIAKKGKVNE